MIFSRNTDRLIAYGVVGVLLLAMATLWGLRLGAYLSWRNWGHGEDPRYASAGADLGAGRPGRLGHRAGERRQPALDRHAAAAAAEGRADRVFEDVLSAPFSRFSDGTACRTSRRLRVSA